MGRTQSVDNNSIHRVEQQMSRNMSSLLPSVQNTLIILKYISTNQVQIGGTYIK